MEKEYAIAHEGDLVATLSYDVLDAILVAALDHFRATNEEELADAVADVIHDVEADRAGIEEATPKTEAEVIKAEADYVALVNAIGPGFHPDTKGADYASLPDGVKASDVDRIVEAAFDHYQHGSDIYGQALDLIHAMDTRPADLDEKAGPSLADGRYVAGPDDEVCTRCGIVVEWSEADSAWWADSAPRRMELICDEAKMIGHAV